MHYDKVKIDNITWHIYAASSGRKLQPLCPIHNLRLYPIGSSEFTTCLLKCEECRQAYILPRVISDEKKYVLDKIDSKIFAQMKVLNLDDEAIEIIKTNDKRDSKYFVTANLVESKVGLRLVIYAGEKGSKEKTQIFVEPKIRRLAFDQNNIHPSDIFLKVEATFNDKTKTIIKKSK